MLLCLCCKNHEIIIGKDEVFDRCKITKESILDINKKPLNKCEDFKEA